MFRNLIDMVSSISSKELVNIRQSALNFPSVENRLMNIPKKSNGDSLLTSLRILLHLPVFLIMEKSFGLGTGIYLEFVSAGKLTNMLTF